MARQGRPVFFSDFHAGMPAAERERHQALMDEALEAIAADPDSVVLYGDSIEGPFIPTDEALEALRWTATVTAFARTVRERLSFFLEMIDRCDVLFSDRVDGNLVFLVCANQEQNLQLIRDAIAGERRMLGELGIDPRDVEVERNMIRVRVPVPSAAAESACC